MRPPTSKRRYVVHPIYEPTGSALTAHARPSGYRVYDRQEARATGVFVTRSRALGAADRMNGRWWREAEATRLSRQLLDRVVPA